MHYPSFREYSDALQLNLGIVLSDPLLGRGTLRTQGPGLPVARSGNFALTFEISVDGRRYAVRCFHKPADLLQTRYEAIGQCLRSIRSPYFVEFEFQPSGITTESGTYPIVRMDWAEGQSLAAFVARHRNDFAALQTLRASLRRLAQHLQDHGIAHGDIQPSNVIVRSATSLRLVDYDGMFVPQLASLQSAELGQPNFQHPGRRARHFDASLDAFSFSLVDLALDALCRRPALWEQTGSGEDAFLLRAADLADPARSPCFSVLTAVPGLEQRVRNFAAICASPFRHAPSFEEFLAGRNIPHVSLVFSGDATRALRPGYASTCEIVDARNFARCCTHVGDRVELIGQVVRVAVSRTPPLDAGCLRVEFADHSHDMVCLKIWPDALVRLAEVPDESWVGQWVGAVGLLEPIYRDGSVTQHHKDISISITEQSQLQRLPETEARYRLLGRRVQTGTALDRTAGVRTDPIVRDTTPQLQVASVPPPIDQPPPDPTALPPLAQEASSPPGRSRAVVVPGRVLRWPWWTTAALIAGLSVVALWSMWGSRTPAPETTRAVAPTPPAPAATVSTPAAGDDVVVRLESQQSLENASLPVETVAGTLTIGSAGEGNRARVVLLNGTALASLRDDVITLAHRAAFTDREVVVGFTRCNGSTAPCGLQQPFWIELRAGSPPKVLQVPGLWAGTGAGAVSAAGADVRIDLGVWNGERRGATLTATGSISVARTRVPIRPLGAADCETVMRSAEACAASPDCRSFASSARRISSADWARLARLYHESTGLDGPAFRALCVRSCELGLTPSRDFIRSNVCNGAQPGQWPSEDPAAGWVR